jgi:predicted TIM-barrel fold metal-dependent hydrolase
MPSTTVDDIPGIISVDDHVVEPPTLWTSRLPSKFASQAPHVERMRVEDYGIPDPANQAEWVDVWRFQEDTYPLSIGEASVGRKPEETTIGFTTYDEIRPGCFQVPGRLEDMDLNGVDVSLCFPNMFVRFCGQRFLNSGDKELALLSVQAYNDWMIEEWAGPSSGRLVANAIIPLWDATLAAAEVSRLAALGCRSVCFSELPTRLGLPSLYSGYWEPFLSACNDAKTVVNVHIGSSSQLPTSSEDAPFGVTLANNYTSSSLGISDWLLSGVLCRYPNLSVSFAEAQAGWIPHLLDRLDGLWHQGNVFNQVRARLPEPPSHYFREHIYACIFDDVTALRFLDMIGDNICFETDYPHADSTWPRSREVAARHFADLSPEQATKILRTNAIRMLGLVEPIGAAGLSREN